jgi:subtilisin family serine protease
MRRNLWPLLIIVRVVRFDWPQRIRLALIVVALVACQASQVNAMMPLKNPPQRKAPSASQRIPENAKHREGELIVKFKKGVDAKRLAQRGLELDGEVLEQLPQLEVVRVRSNRGERMESLLKRYRQNPSVEYAEANLIIKTLRVPNDELFPYLWGLQNDGSLGGVVDADIDATQAWDFIRPGLATVLVADIDSGSDYTHEDLQANMWTNTREIPNNGIDDDHNGYIDDVRGWNFFGKNNNPMDDNLHGTHTAGTIGALSNNGIGIAGVAWNVKIMPLKFTDELGNGTCVDAALAIRYAANNGAKISNNSWGVEGYCQVLEDAIRYADSKGMLFVVAAGNDGVLTTTYPCISVQPNVLCVAASDIDDSLAPFSNFSPTKVHIAAPGVDIVSTIPPELFLDLFSYFPASGTSMAAPHVAGAAAMLLSQRPDLTVPQLKSILLSSVDKKTSLTGLVASGGRLNVNNAVVAVLSDRTPPSIPVLSVTSINVTSIGLSWTRAIENVGLPAYRLERCQGVGCTTFTQITATSSLTLLNTARLPNTTYRYRVRAVDGAGNLSGYSTIVTVKTLPDTTPPTVPSGLSATATSATQISLGWSAAADNVAVTGYRLERCMGTSCTSFSQIAATSSRVYIDPGRLPGTTYRYRVRAVDGAGNLGGYSPTLTIVIPK